VRAERGKNPGGHVPGSASCCGAQGEAPRPAQVVSGNDIFVRKNLDFTREFQGSRRKNPCNYNETDFRRVILASILVAGRARELNQFGNFRL
jgi:hypothetical protein